MRCQFAGVPLLALALAACAPAKRANEPLRETRAYRKRDVQATFTQTGTRLHIVTRRGQCDIEERELARDTSSGTSPALPSIVFGRIDPKVLLVGVGFLGLSSPFFVMGAHAKTANDRTLAYGYAIGFAAVGAGVLIALLATTISVEPREIRTLKAGGKNPVLSEVWKKDVPCPEPEAAPWISVSLRAPDGGAHLGKSDLYGVLEIDLRTLDAPLLGDAPRAQLVVADRAFGEVDLSEIQRDRAAARERRERAAQEAEARAWAEVDIPACLAGVELACTVAAQHLQRFPAGPHAAELREALRRKAEPKGALTPRSCADACLVRCDGSADCAKICESRWCK